MNFIASNGQYVDEYAIILHFWKWSCWDTSFWANLIEDLQVIKKFTCGLKLTYLFIDYFSAKTTAELSIFYNEKWVHKLMNLWLALET